MVNSGTCRKMYTLTAMLAKASASSSVGSEPPSASHAMAAPAPPTMNKAFSTLLAAITRARRSSGVRAWMFACSGTTNRPAKTPISTRSINTRVVPSAPRNAHALRKPSAPANALSTAPRAKCRSMPKTLTPTAPTGTNPISTRRLESRSQSSEPMPMATVKDTSTNVTTDGPPPSRSGTSTGICAR